MFAVVRTGGKQYRVAPGDKIVVEKLDGNAGDKITLGDVLLAGDGHLKSTDGLTVAAEIVAQAKGDKVTVFKKRRRHNYRRKKGHRQQHTILKIVAIGDHKEQKKAAPKAARRSPSRSDAGSSREEPAAALRTKRPRSNRTAARSRRRRRHADREPGSDGQRRRAGADKPERRLLRPRPSAENRVDKKCCTC